MADNTIHDALTNRRSVRKFIDRAVPADVIRKIAEDAQWTPSWANAQPWKLYVATGDTAREIRRDYQSGSLPSETDLPSFRDEHWGIREQRNMGHWGQQLRGFLSSDAYQFGEGQKNLFNAPTIAVITISKDAPVWEILDAGAFEQSLLLSAYNQGVDTIVAVAFVAHASYLHKKLNIPDDEAVVMGIGMGYRGDDKINKFKSDRVPLDDILTIKD